MSPDRDPDTALRRTADEFEERLERVADDIDEARERLDAGDHRPGVDSDASDQ